MLHQPLCIGELPMELADLRTRTHVHKQSGSQDVAAPLIALRCSPWHYAGYTLSAQAIATSL